MSDEMLTTQELIEKLREAKITNNSYFSDGSWWCQLGTDTEPSTLLKQAADRLEEMEKLLGQKAKE